MIRELMFAGLSNLRTLYMGGSHIHTIEQNSFKDNMALQLLNLQRNSIETLSRCIFDGVNHPTNLNKLQLKNNPLRCETLCWLKQAEVEGWITVDEASLTVCSGSGVLNGRKWDSIEEHELSCHSE